ncbi:PREDICTED: E3 ubiquitin-protein ligase RNF144A-like [Camelina sativa]|uniref:RBR-type E3 ubiquitin transferase n=1 Tax=Camelina sativa TaxID=90675 RepID=A0ABM0TUG0_CAMSA|nr:PREDICTED: E3 ubiquitin-protein ligase RNF144A-like [Camelina sativa]
MEEEVTLVRADDLSPAGKPLYRLYFKGLVNREPTMFSAGFGVAICSDKDDLLFDMDRPIPDRSITLLEAELIALKCGLEKAVIMQIKHISICCDDDEIFELVMERSTPERESTALLLRDIQGIRKYLTSSIPVLLTQDQANKLETCTICLNDDIDADQMFLVAKCGHMFCSECFKRHIEVELRQRSLIRCPQYHRCYSLLTYRNCVNILTPKLKEMWQQRIKDDSIPVTNRVYCPNPRCSTLMSKTELSAHIGVRRRCVKCSEPFCISCKVPWHTNLSCNGYKKLHPNPTIGDEKLKRLANKKLWRQCNKCQQMIELSDGCVSVLCRCGHEFCYRCGADAGGCPHGHKYFPQRALTLWRCCFVCF